jgi:tetratricopeptide (TPR) repeat protein
MMFDNDETLVNWAMQILHAKWTDITAPQAGRIEVAVGFHGNDDEIKAKLEQSLRNVMADNNLNWEGSKKEIFSVLSTTPPSKVWCMAAIEATQSTDNKDKVSLLLKSLSNAPLNTETTRKLSQIVSDLAKSGDSYATALLKEIEQVVVKIRDELSRTPLKYDGKTELILGGALSRIDALLLVIKLTLHSTQKQGKQEEDQVSSLLERLKEIPLPTRTTHEFDELLEIIDTLAESGDSRAIDSLMKIEQVIFKFSDEMVTFKEGRTLGDSIKLAIKRIEEARNERIMKLQREQSENLESLQTRLRESMRPEGAKMTGEVPEQKRPPQVIITSKESDSLLGMVSQIQSQGGQVIKVVDGELKEISGDEIELQKRAREFEKIGNDHYAQENYPQAIKAYQNALEIYPDEVLYMNIGNAYCSMGQVEVGVAYLEKSLELNPAYERTKKNLEAARAMLRPDAPGNPPTGAESDPKIIDEPIAGLKDRSMMMILAAARILGVTGSGRAVEALLETLDQWDYENLENMKNDDVLTERIINGYKLRGEIALALAQLGDRRAVAPLINSLSMDLSDLYVVEIGMESVKRNELTVLDSLDRLDFGWPQSVEARSIIPFVRQELSSESALVRALAEKILARIESHPTKEHTVTWQNGPECGNCGKTTILISEQKVSELLNLSGVPEEERQQAPKTAYRCGNCQQVSCLQCAFNTGKSLGLTLPACHKCHSTHMDAIA